MNKNISLNIFVLIRNIYFITLSAVAVGGMILYLNLIYLKYIILVWYKENEKICCIFYSIKYIYTYIVKMVWEKKGEMPLFWIKIIPIWNISFLKLLFSWIILFLHKIFKYFLDILGNICL